MLVGRAALTLYNCLEYCYNGICFDTKGNKTAILFPVAWHCNCIVETAEQRATTYVIRTSQQQHTNVSMLVSLHLLVYAGDEPGLIQGYS